MSQRSICFASYDEPEDFWDCTGSTYAQVACVKIIVTEAAPNKIVTNSTPRRTSRTGVVRTTPGHSWISEASTQSPSENIGTRINGINGTSNPPPSGINGTSVAPPAGCLWIPRIGNMQQYTSPNLRESNELNSTIDGKFSNNPIAPPFITQ